MKKTFLTVITMLSLGILAVSATDTTTSSTDNTQPKPKLEKMGTQQKDSNLANRQTPPKGAPKPGQRPNKKPNSKPGGDRVPPEFSHSNSNSPASTAK